MPLKQKKELRWAISRANELLARNADPCETFEGVLNQWDVRALKTLVKSAEETIAGRKASPRPQA